MATAKAKLQDPPAGEAKAEKSPGNPTGGEVFRYGVAQGS